MSESIEVVVVIIIIFDRPPFEETMTDTTMINKSLNT